MFAYLIQRCKIHTASSLLETSSNKCKHRKTNSEIVTTPADIFPFSIRVMQNYIFMI